MAARQGRPELTRRALIRKLALPVAGIARLPVVGDDPHAHGRVRVQIDRERIEAALARDLTT
jgi:hypothetical protein